MRHAATTPGKKSPPPPATPLHVLTRRQGNRDPGRGGQTRQGSKRFQLLAPLPCLSHQKYPARLFSSCLAVSGGLGYPRDRHPALPTPVLPPDPGTPGVLGGTSNAPVSGPSPVLLSPSCRRPHSATSEKQTVTTLMVFSSSRPAQPHTVLPGCPWPATPCVRRTSCPCCGTVLALGPWSRCHSPPADGGGHDGRVGVWTKTHLRVACPGPAGPCDGFPGLDSKAGTPWPWPVLLKVHTYIPSAASLAGEPLYIVRRLMSSWPSSTPSSSSGPVTTQSTSRNIPAGSRPNGAHCRMPPGFRCRRVHP